jgi:hypothetical protein
VADQLLNARNRDDENESVWEPDAIPSGAPL